MQTPSKDHTVEQFLHRDVVRLKEEWTINDALEHVRNTGVGERILYFYVVDADGKLTGVVPTRRLLLAVPNTRIAELMVRKMVTVRPDMPLDAAYELFVMHRFLAIPVVDETNHLLGVIDVNNFHDEVLDLAERRNFDTVFEAIGLRIKDTSEASAAKAFRLRFPWLLATIGSGTLCALLAGAYEVTLAQSIVLAFFITLVLGLGESVSSQSMTLAIQKLRSVQPTFGWFGKAVTRELSVTGGLGLVCGLIVAGIVYAWHREVYAALAIGGSILGALLSAGFIGLGVPTTLHALKLDPRVAAGPLTLAMADLATLAIYFNLGLLLLS